MHTLIHKYEGYFAPTGRIIVGAYFVLSGIPKLLDLGGTAGFIESVGLPAGMLLAFLAAVLEIGAGLALIMNRFACCGALILAAYILILSFPFHGPALWEENPMQKVTFMKNMALMGALLFMSAHLHCDCSGKKKKGDTEEMPQQPITPVGI